MKPTSEVTANSWPRHETKQVETRKRDVVVRIADWSRDKDEPAFDVEVYAHGVYDWNLSQTFSVTREGGKANAKKAAAAFAAKRIAELL